MAETKKKKKIKKVTISPEDVSLILQRYSATQILVLLREVKQCPDANINWNEMVKNTSTKIKSAREMQMLWRHLAYRSSMEENIEDEAEPLDDDSDLESELEAQPPVSSETSTEAAACAKVLLACFQSSSGPSNSLTVEAPLIINIPKIQASSDNPESAFEQGTNIIVPVFVQKQPTHSVISKAEGPEGNGATGGGGLPARKKRKPWTEEEDMELIAAVQKCGERNWANIVKGDFKGDRNASQLSQRWSVIKKRHANLNIVGTGNRTNSQLSEQQLANRAVSHALNMPMVDSLLAACSAGATRSGIPSSSVAAAEEASLVSKTAVGSSISQAVHQAGNSVQKVSSSITVRSRVTAKKVLPAAVNSSLGPNPMLQATAVAAGARIATPSTAASLLKATNSKNTFHVRPVGSSVIKPSVAGGTKPLATNQLGTRSNVHFIRTGLSSASVPTYSDPVPSIPKPDSSQQEHSSNKMEPPVLTDSVPPPTADRSSLAAEQISARSPVTSCGTVKGKNANAIPKGNVKVQNIPAKELKEYVSGNMHKESGNGEGTGPNSEVRNEVQKLAVKNPSDSQNMKVDEKDQLPIVNDPMES